MHRARGQARREQLLVAAIEVVAERGTGAATHRAIAERAGVPASTTTYFFSSIRELILEAMRHFTMLQVEQLAAFNTVLEQRSSSLAEIAGLFADALCAAPTSHNIAQFEAYLTAARVDDPDDKAAITGVMAAFEEIAAAALRAFGVERAEEVAPLFVAVVDGLSLRHIATGEPAERDLMADVLHRLMLSYASVPYGSLLPDSLERDPA